VPQQHHRRQSSTGPLIDALKQLSTVDAEGSDCLFIEKVQHRIEALIPLHRCSRHFLCAELHLHPRTLNRRLRERGTTYQDLVSEIRFALAIERLHRTPMTISEIAEELGYSEPSAFCRAFRAWSGMPPERWRAVRSATPACQKTIGSH
jgi:AraC-like DNA-binding protein